jgi:hypothetical protein
MPSADVEFLELCGMPGPGAPPSIFSTLPGRAALPAAVDALVRSFELAFRRYRPSLVLLDSLYSALGILVHAAGIAWATYETDLPRELDPMVPPPSCCIVPGRPESPLLLRRAWATCLWQAYLARQASRKQPVGFAWSMTSYFPDALIHELERRFGRRVEFDRRSLYPPVARAPRLVFCPRELDFERSGSSELAWVGPCIDERRPEPHFRFQDLPANVPLAYCALGTRSLRSPEALELLRTIVRTFAERDDFFLVLACPERQREALGPELAGARRSVWAVAAAPQLALLRRASLAIIHAGFNSVKECAAYGVPMLALPLSHDQPRNAALISYRGLGVALDFRRLTRSLLHQRLTEVRDSAHIRANGLAMRDVLRASMARGAELDCIDALIDGGSARAEPHVSRAEAAPRASSGVAGSPGLGGQAEGCAVS